MFDFNIELDDKDFRWIRDYVGRTCGIQLTAGKEHLVRNRLAKRLRELRLSSYSQYIELLQKDGGEELRRMVELLTTHKTSFFREAAHFDLLRAHVVPRMREELRGRIWSAGCSTGEEPYSLAMMLREEIRDIQAGDIRILATDLSGAILEKAKQGRYRKSTLEDLPPGFASKYFRALPGGDVEVAPDLKALISFARLNLMEKWPMRGPFDVILCRNVMIYFNRETQQDLVERFSHLLAPGGFLLVGHSESLTGFRHSLRYTQPAVYRK